MATVFDPESLRPVALIDGDDEEETRLLREAAREAEQYLRSFRWCLSVRDARFGDGIGGIVGVFLFRADVANVGDEWLWVVAGDLPSAYLVVDELPTAVEALDRYCGLMMEWVAAVREGRALDDVYPVRAEPTAEMARTLESRVAVLRDVVIPELRLPRSADDQPS